MPTSGVKALSAACKNVKQNLGGEGTINIIALQLGEGSLFNLNKKSVHLKVDGGTSLVGKLVKLGQVVWALLSGLGSVHWVIVY